MRIAEGHDPLIVHQQEIENRQMEVCIHGASSNLVGASPGCSKKVVYQLFIGANPGKCPNGEQLRSFLCHFQGNPRSFPPTLPGNTVSLGFRKGFLNHLGNKVFSMTAKL